MCIIHCSFDFCTSDEHDSPVENLGQVLFGERIRPSPYEISFREDKTCSKLCTKKYSKDSTEQQEKLATLMRGIALNYQHHWCVFLSASLSRNSRHVQDRRQHAGGVLLAGSKPANSMHDWLSDGLHGYQGWHSEGRVHT